MKKTLLKIITASLCLALPISISSCDGSSSTANNNNSNNDNGGNETSEENDDIPLNDGDCFEGQTYQFIGSQTTTTETTTPIATTTSTELSYDIIIEFMANGVNRVTGTLNVASITLTINGINTNVSAGLGAINVDQMSTYTCPEGSIDNTDREVTVIQGGITTVYRLTFTSETTGTFVATVTGTQDGATINASSSGSFSIL